MNYIVSSGLTVLRSLNYEIHNFSIVSATSYTVDNQQSLFYIQYHTQVVIVYAYCNLFCQVSSPIAQLTRCHVCLGHAMLVRPSHTTPELSNVQGPDLQNILRLSEDYRKIDLR